MGMRMFKIRHIAFVAILDESPAAIARLARQRCGKRPAA